MSSLGGRALPALGQVGVVVKDLDQAMAYYRDVFGLGPFQVIEFTPEKHWVKGKPVPINLKIGLAQMGPVHFELIQPVAGDAPHKWFLEENGEGLQHLGFYLDDLDGWLSYLEAKGIEVLMNAETYVEGMGDVRAAYVESDKTGGVIFELIEVKPRA
ncbi:MAG: VOC family protein [Thermodesulfobacteriota bacterium]